MSGIEPRLLIGPQDRAHGKDVLERRFLEIAHRHVGRIHRRRHARAILVLGRNRCREPRIVSLEPCFERSAAGSKIALKRLKPRFLRDIEIEVLVHQCMEFGAAVVGCGLQHSPEPHARHAKRDRTSDV